MLELLGVKPESTAAGLGLRPGDYIVSINNEDVRDVIDFHYLASDDRITIRVLTKEGRTRILRVRKDTDDLLGIEFPPLAVTRCRNKCIFCFVDQMPPGCRKTLYVKDDDFRASFLYGNFITLGALTEQDFDRIFRQRLSPLYISVHATDPQVRASMLRNRKVRPILESLKRLADAGIRMHTQIVLVPGVNDGDQLIRTVRELAALFPAVRSIAVVPVGLTGFRRNLFPLRTFSVREARAVVETISKIGRGFKQVLGTRLVFPSDEFYVKAGESVPGPGFYEDFPQIENGVGMIASFLRDVSRVKLPLKTAPLTMTVITGSSFSNLLKRVLDPLRGIEGVRVRQVTAKNTFFGPSVTVAGLLTGSDIVAAMRGKRPGDVLVVPSNAVKEDEAVFLDGMTVERLQTTLGTEVALAGSFRELVSLLKRERRPKR